MVDFSAYVFFLVGRFCAGVGCSVNGCFVLVGGVLFLFVYFHPVRYI